MTQERNCYCPHLHYTGLDRDTAVGSASIAEVTEVKNGIVRADYAIPVGNQRFIHFLHIPERTVAETDYISVTEVGV